MGKHVITDEHVEVIVQLGEKGRGDAFIADRLREQFGIKISPSAIHWHKIKHCAEPPSRVAIPAVPTTRKLERRGDHVVRRFTQSEDAQLLALAKQGLSDTEIGKRLSRRTNSVRGRLHTLARHDDRRERAAAQVEPTP